jgi:hypothetical protein
MASKKKWVAFRTNAIIPAAVIGKDEDEKVNAGAPVHLPADYADHVVNDHFAEPCDAPKPASKKKSGSATKPPAGPTEVEIAAAEAAVTAAEARLSEVEGTDEEADAQAALTVAREALAALQPAS